jgi:Skp family chaperone for outer membrane proteins
MNRKSVLLAALVAGLLPLAASAQASPAPPAAAAPVAGAPPAAPPQAIPAKIALIAFEQAVIATNEGQRTVQDVQKKFEPQKAKIDALAAEVESLKKQAEAGKATMPAEEFASRTRTIDTKQKQLDRDAEDAQTAYNADLQEAYSKVAQKVNIVLQNYVKQNGFTLLLDVSNQQSAVMWALPETDVTEAVITAYNTSSGVTAPPPAAPSASRPAPRPAAPAAPRTTTPKPPTP